MRFIGIVKAAKEYKPGAPANANMMAEMRRYNDELSKAGLLIEAIGLHPISRGKRMRISDDSAPSSTARSPRALELIGATGSCSAGR
jgi:hypothetical protein